MAERRRGEFELIADLFAPLSGGDARALGLADDAAVIPQRDGYETVVTTDTMVAGIHFLDIEEPETVARRLLRVNLSDIAAKGAEPVAYFLNLTLAADISDGWLEAFARGLRTDQERYGLVLLGGDTTHTTGPLTLSITLMGEAPRGTAVRRSGARDGDVVMVSGTVGDAFLGLAALQAGEAAAGGLIERFQLPEPRLGLGLALRGIATAMADISDGLVADLGHICEAGGLGAEIDAAAAPLSREAHDRVATGQADLAALLTGGDDYELVFTVPPDRQSDALSAAAAAAVAVTSVGRMSSGRAGVVVTGPDGRPMAFDRPGYRHF